MPAFVIALIRSISEPAAYAKYVAQVQETLDPFGGRFIARKPDPEPLEGGPAPARAIILQFDSEAQARAWHASPAYRPVMELRRSASDGMLLVLPGYQAPASVAAHEVCYIEMVSADVGSTQRLCADLHGWKFSAPDPALGSAVVARLPNGGRCGIRAPMSREETLTTRIYVSVPDIIKATERAAELGAMIALPPTDLPGHGTISIYIMGGVEQGLWQLPST